MIRTEERNKLVVEAKADIINRRHHGKIYIKTDPAEYSGSMVTIPTLSGASAFSFNHEILDDTPGRPAFITKRTTISGNANGYSDLDDKLLGKDVKHIAKKASDTVDKINRGLSKAIEDDSEQALDDFFASLLK